MAKDQESKVRWELLIAVATLVVAIVAYLRPPDPAHPIRLDFLSKTISLPLWLCGVVVVGIVAITTVIVRLRIGALSNTKSLALTHSTPSIARFAPIPARLKVNIKFLKTDSDPTRIAIVIQNSGGTDALHLHISDIHIFQKTTRFPQDILSIPAGKSSDELQPVIIEYPDSIAHDMPGAMYEASQAGANIRNNDAFDYPGEVTFYDGDGNQFRAVWRYTFYPKKYFTAKNPPLAKYPDQQEKIDLGPFLVVSDVTVEKIAHSQYSNLETSLPAVGEIQRRSQPAVPTNSPYSTVNNDKRGEKDLTISSPNDFAIKITRDEGVAKGLIVTAYNHGLNPISQIFITVRTAQSFDSHHHKFRNSSNFNAIRIDMLDIIQPSSKGRSTWFIRKEPDRLHLFLGNDFSHEMIWPEIDKSEMQKWLLNIGIRAQTAPRNSSEKASVFTETMHHIVLIWDTNAGEFFIRKADVSEVLPNTNVRV
jgi:hypothetical protein